MRYAGFPDFPSRRIFLQSMQKTIHFMISSDDKTINEAGVSLELSVNKHLPDATGFFVQQPLSVITEDGPFAAAISYGLTKQRTSEGCVIQISPTLIISKVYSTLDEVGRGLVLSKEWFSLEGLPRLARHYGFKNSLSPQEADHIVGAVQLRLENEAYGLAKMCRAYE